MPVDIEKFPNDPLRRLEAIMAALRGPEGCPWDREQDHKSLRTNLLEEAYEVLDVLDNADDIDTDKLVEELGDLLLQIVFHAQLGAERNDFNLDEIAIVISEKLISRHPHVFDSTKVSGSGEVLRNWERLKIEEGKDSALSGIPRSLPALQRAAHLMSKAQRAGFKWQSRDQAVEKIREELEEFEDTISRSGSSEAGQSEEMEQEFGDLLLALVCAVMEFGVDPEAALRGSADKFEKRFRNMENRLPAEAESLHELDFSELLDLWRSARAEKADQDSSAASDSSSSSMEGMESSDRTPE